MPSPSLVLLLALLTTGAPTQAQAPAPAALPAPGPRVPIWPHDQVLTDVAADGTVWASAAMWKAGFDRTGATFHPFLGAQAPSSPATFALQAARCGTTPLVVTTAAPRLAGQRVTFARGDVEERFELRPTGIEQQFVLTSLPNRQTLWLDVVVTTALAWRHDGDHTFVGPHGGVRYGGAIAIDATGRRQQLQTTWVEGVLRLGVPATFLADATLPLLVDPLIGSIGNATANDASELRATDIGFDQSLGEYFVAYERAFSATDHDVYVVRLDSAMQSLGTVTIDYTSAYWSKPRLAVLEAHDKVGVVAETSTGGVSPIAVGMRTFTAGASPALDAPFTAASALFGGDTFDPDLGGDGNATGPQNFLLAYESKDYATASVPRWRLISPLGVLASTQAIGISIGLHRRLTVSKTCGLVGGNTEGWCIVHRQETSGQTSGRLIAWFITRAGTFRQPVGSSQYVALTAPTSNLGSEWDVSSPTDATNGRMFVCVERRYDLLALRGSLVGHSFDHLGNLLASDVPLVGGTVDRRAPAIDSDGTRFALAQVDRFNANDSDVRLHTLAVIGNQLVEQDDAVVTLATTRDDQPAVCAQRVVANRYGVAWTHFANGSYAIQCQPYSGTGALGIGIRPTACGGLGIQYAGSLALGDTFTVTIDNQTGIGAFLAGASVNVPIGGCAGCTLGADGVTLLGSQLVIPVPTNPALVGSMLAMQGVRYDPFAGPCLGMLAFSNTLDVVIR